MLAHCYYYGIGCDEDINAAKKLYLEASKDLEHISVFRILGVISYGEDAPETFEYCSKYLEHDPKDYEVYSCLADCYYKGLGITTDVKKALSIYEEISRTEYADTIDFQVRYGGFLDKLESEESIAWFLKAAEKDAWASYRLADIFKDARYLDLESYQPEYRIKCALYFYKNAFDLAMAENDSRLANLAKNAETIFRARLGADAFAFYYKLKNGEEIAYRCRMNE